MKKKTEFKPGNMLYPLPAVLVSVADKEGKSNLFTVAWTGTVCTNPPMVYISVRPERYSYSMIDDVGEFVINLTTEDLAYATDFCGVKSGREVDKWKKLGLTKIKSRVVSVPSLEESPVNIECRVRKKIKLGSHDMFLADVVAVQVDEQYMDESNCFHFNDSTPIVYSHGEYYSLGNLIENFGFSVKKKKK